MHPTLKKKKKKKITLTVLDFINASIQWQNYHRWLEFWSLFVRENNNRIDGKYMNGVSLETCIFVRKKAWALLLLLVGCPWVDVMVRSGTVGEGGASRSKYMHTFRKVYIYINLNIVFCQVIQKCVCSGHSFCFSLNSFMCAAHICPLEGRPPSYCSERL